MAFHKHIKTGSFHKELERNAIKFPKQDVMDKKFLMEIITEMFSEMSWLNERTNLQSSNKKFSPKGIDCGNFENIRVVEEMRRTLKSNRSPGNKDQTGGCCLLNENREGN